MESFEQRTTVLGNWISLICFSSFINSKLAKIDKSSPSISNFFSKCFIPLATLKITYYFCFTIYIYIIIVSILPISISFVFNTISCFLKFLHCTHLSQTLFYLLFSNFRHYSLCILSALFISAL